MEKTKKGKVEDVDEVMHRGGMIKDFLAYTNPVTIFIGAHLLAGIVIGVIFRAVGRDTFIVLGELKKELDK